MNCLSKVGRCVKSWIPYIAPGRAGALCALSEPLMRDQLQIGDAAERQEGKLVEHKTNAAGKGRKSIAIVAPFAARCGDAQKSYSDGRAVSQILLLSQNFSHPIYWSWHVN